MGATSKIASECAKLWIQNQTVNLSLVGRNKEKTDRIANDLTVRSPEAKISVLESGFTDPKEIQATVDKICQEKPVDIVLIAHGNLVDQKLCQDSLDISLDSMMINGISPVLFAEGFAKKMECNNHGVIALIGSVAGDRGRKSNYVYGSAKGLMERYAEGMQHRFSGSGVNIVLVKPGPTDTPMTAEMKSSGMKLSPVEPVAKEIVSGIEKGKPVIYSPLKWWIIMTIIKHIPRCIFNKLNI